MGFPCMLFNIYLCAVYLTMQLNKNCMLYTYDLEGNDDSMLFL